MLARSQAPPNAVLMRVPLTCRQWLSSFVGHPVRAAEDLALTVRKVGEFRDHARVQGNSSRLTVPGRRESDMAATEIDLSPVEPECLSSASAGIEEEGHQRSKMLAARCDQSVRFARRQSR